MIVILRGIAIRGRMVVGGRMIGLGLKVRLGKL